MIRIENLHFAVGTFALKGLSLHVAPSEYFVLLGPSGSGKTLLAECLCGLNRIDSGRIRIGGCDVTDLEPRNRGIGYLPQDYALFPHKTVRQNISFGPESRRVPRPAVEKRVESLMEMVGVAHLADRFPQKLSGGEQQRVALARALAIEPQLLLLDEPVSALDEQTRDTLCRQLRGLQRQTRTTAVHICHNFAEMLTVADRVGVIYQGRILQVGTPEEIIQRPQNAIVARFVQAGNLFSARPHPEGEWLRLDCGGGAELRARRPDADPLGTEVTVMVRSENILLTSTKPENPALGTAVLQGSITHTADMGPLVRVTVAYGRGVELVVSLGKREYNSGRARVGDQVYLAIAPDHVHVMTE